MGGHPYFTFGDGTGASAAPLIVFGYHPYRLRRLKKRRFLSLEQRMLQWQERLQIEYRFNTPQAAVIISEIAYRQTEDLESDAQQRFEELARELEAEGIEWESRYLEALNAQRERLIEAEIGELLKAKLDEEEAMMLIMLTAYV